MNDVVCTSSSAHECLEAHAAALDGKRALIQLNIVSDSSGDFLQFNSPVGADLLDFLTGAGYGPTTCSGVGPCAPEVFPYDFRRDIAALAEDLYTKIKQVASDSPGRPVAIVTHSMGSLVTAAMIAQHRDLYTSGLLNTVISMGAPFAGGLTTYLYAQGFRAFTPFLSASNTALLGNNWTSVYELLPQWQFLTPNPLGLSLDSIYQGAYDPIDLPGLPRAQQQDLINQRDNVWNEISNLGGNINGLASEPFWNAIIGYSQPTASEIDKSSNLGFDSVSTPIFALSKPCYTLQLDDGDGEVPLTASAQGSLIPARRIYVQEQHAMLPQNAAVAHGILNILNGASPFTVSGLLSEDDFVNLRKMQPFAVKNTILINSCSPLTVSAEDSSGDIINSQVSQIQGAKYANVGDATQIELPWNDTFTIIVTGTGTGTFDLVVRGFGGQHAPLGYIFKAVPVRTGSQGIVTVGGSSVPTLQYNYAGKNIIDTIPANVNPPTILCTGCYFITQNLRATFAFNVGYLGGVSTFTYNYRSSSQTVQFVSTKTSQISVSGNTANFSGEGTLNGQTGYSFAIAAKDGGAAGSGLDTVSITITGPNSYSYTANATVAGGDVVVHQ
ncbi:MAG: hypothetical protein JOZ48_01040 [Acidobacteriaceae bacterium]|nr:hypothetical protein [Acidobacteriaceae bacterium]